MPAAALHHPGRYIWWLLPIKLCFYTKDAEKFVFHNENLKSECMSHKTQAISAIVFLCIVFYGCKRDQGPQPISPHADSTRNKNPIDPLGPPDSILDNTAAIENLVGMYVGEVYANADGTYSTFTDTLVVSHRGGDSIQLGNIYGRIILYNESNYYEYHYNLHDVLKVTFKPESDSLIRYSSQNGSNGHGGWSEFKGKKL